MGEKEINFQPPIAIRGLSIKRIFNQAQYFRIVNYDQVSTWKFEYPILVNRPQICQLLLGIVINKRMLALENVFVGKTLHPTLITSAPARHNEYADVFVSMICLDDLFGWPCWVVAGFTSNILPKFLTPNKEDGVY